MMIVFEEIDVNRPVPSYGIDSLVAAEMRNWCFEKLKADIRVFGLPSGNTITSLSEQIASRLTMGSQGLEGEKLHSGYYSVCVSIFLVSGWFGHACTG